MEIPLREFWRLNPDIDFLNHGSFGAMPIVVWEAQRGLIEQLERDPVAFLGPERSLLPKLAVVRERIAALVGAPAEDLAFVRNATDGVNAVLRSFPLSSGDEVIVSNHGYNACNNAARFVADRAGANVVVAEIPFPIRSAQQVIDAIEKCISKNTRLLLIDHVTSPTGLVLPINEIVDLAHHHGVRVLVDGAHAPGMLPVDLGSLDADYYTANHHKWLCGPKTSGFLYVRPDLQSEVRPTVISHGANSAHLGETTFLAEFNWIGTYDPTPLLAMPAAIDFLTGLRAGGLTELMEDNRSLALRGRSILTESLGIDLPAPPDMIGSLASIPLSGLRGQTRTELEAFQVGLFERNRIEVPIFALNGDLPCLRISAQAYNSIDQYERLADALGETLARR